MAQVTMIAGSPASGKSTETQMYLNSGYVNLNRDSLGGRTMDLLPKMVAELRAGRDVVMDNVFVSREKRAPFIKAAHECGAVITGIEMDTEIEDAQINVLQRMYRKYGRIFWTSADKDNTDPGVFPIQVLFKFRKEWEPLSMDEGFDGVTVVHFQRSYPAEYCNKAVIFDFDDTLRTVVGGDYKYPTKPEEIQILPDRAEAIRYLRERGYLILGASNQSGIAKGHLSMEQAKACFEHTVQAVGGMDYVFCPHHVPPISCYCRKPQSGMLVHFIEKYRLDPGRCLVVGDMTTDKTWATRLGMKFQYAYRFFATNPVRVW